MKIKKLFVILCMILMLSLTSCEKVTEFPKASDDVIKGSYEMLYMDGTKKEKSYEYSDAYFKNEEFNLDLMRMSYNAAYSYSNVSKNGILDYVFKELFTNLGYSSFYANPYYFEKTDLDNIGMLFASKKVYIKDKDYTIIASVLRGGDYYYEWAANFIVGNEGDHKGFKTASIKYIDELNKYAKSVNAKDTILWLSGYSRAGAVANLSASYIDNYINYKNTQEWLTEEYKIENLDFDLELNNLYCYTFEAPNGALDKNTKALNEVTKNIYNICNDADVVQMVLPKSFSFTKYGNVKSYNLADDSDLLKKTNELFDNKYKNKVNLYGFSFIKTENSTEIKLSDTTKLYLNKLDETVYTKKFFEDEIAKIADIFETREKYSELFDELIEEVFSKVRTLDDANLKKLTDNLLNNFKDSVMTSILLKSQVEDNIKKAFDTVNLKLSDKAYTKIGDIHSVLRSLLFNLLKTDDLGNFGHVAATLYVNINDLTINHYPELIYAFVNAIK